jgi:hypothetical protein
MPADAPGSLTPAQATRRRRLHPADEQARCRSHGARGGLPEGTVESTNAGRAFTAALAAHLQPRPNCRFPRSAR